MWHKRDDMSSSSWSVIQDLLRSPEDPQGKHLLMSDICILEKSPESRLIATRLLYNKQETILNWQYQYTTRKYRWRVTLAKLKFDQAPLTAHRAGYDWSTLGLCLLFALLTGCAGSERSDDGSTCVKGNFEQVTLCPGASALCATDPCTVLFRMPPGEGEYQVTSNNLDRGTFPAGQTADLGAFWRGTHYIEVQDSGAPAAYFRVIGDR